MATAILVFHQAGNRSLERESMPVVRLAGSRSEVLTTGATSVSSTLLAEGAGSTAANVFDGGFVTVTAVGADLWVDCGAAPTAAKPTATGTGYPVLDGQSVTFAVRGGDRVAAIEWS